MEAPIENAVSVEACWAAYCDLGLGYFWVQSTNNTDKRRREKNRV
jgi:hypothetical protein